MVHSNGKSTLLINGRKIKIVTGEKTQTVNVCDHTNKEGTYAHKIRIYDRELFVTAKSLEAQHFLSVQDLLNFLTQRPQTEVEDEGEGTLDIFRKRNGPLFSIDQSWTKKIIPDVERSINRLIDEFMQNPYLHRVEHSLHCQLYCHLVDTVELGKTETYGQLSVRRVQKEWPETIPRPENGNRRGNFDLVVLGPTTSSNETLHPKDFKQGLIGPGVVIEIGLDYDLDHLKEDHSKMTNSKVRFGYLIHLARPTGDPQNRNDLEQYIEMLMAKEHTEKIFIAYAQVDEERKLIRYRRLGEASITSVAKTR